METFLPWECTYEIILPDATNCSIIFRDGRDSVSRLSYKIIKRKARYIILIRLVKGIGF